MSVSFQFFSPLSFFQKADAPAGQRNRIAGVISTELKDKQDEVILQRGLDFSPFLKSGWFNDNHSKDTVDVLGYPESVKQFQKGEVLPDGTRAEANGTWSEGYLLDTPKAKAIWDLGHSLQKAGGKRRLGFSIEGNVQKRTGPGNRTVAKAVVRNVAVTNCPVSEGTRLEVLAKSLDAVEKGLSMGPAPTPPGTSVSAAGPITGEGAGSVLAPQSLESDARTLVKNDEDDDEEGELTKSSAVAAIQNRLSCDRETAEQTYALFLNLKQHHLL